MRAMLHVVMLIMLLNGLSCQHPRLHSSQIALAMIHQNEQSLDPIEGRQHHGCSERAIITEHRSGCITYAGDLSRRFSPKFPLSIIATARCGYKGPLVLTVDKWKHTHARSTDTARPQGGLHTQDQSWMHAYSVTSSCWNPGLFTGVDDPTTT